MKNPNDVILGTFQLNNNCPECYSNDGLHLTFRQQHIENFLLKRLSQETTHDMFCKTCNTTIYPIQWDDSIERVVAYHHRAVKPKKSSWKLKPAAYIFIAIDLLILISIILVVTGVIKL